MKNLAIAAAAKLASLKQAAAEFPHRQYFSRHAPTGMGYLDTLGTPTQRGKSGIVVGWC